MDKRIFKISPFAKRSMIYNFCLFVFCSCYVDAQYWFLYETSFKQIHVFIHALHGKT